MAIEITTGGVTKSFRFFPYDAIYVDANGNVNTSGNGRQVREAWFDGVKYYPESKVPSLPDSEIRENGSTYRAVIIGGWSGVIPLEAVHGLTPLYRYTATNEHLTKFDVKGYASELSLLPVPVEFRYSAVVYSHYHPITHEYRQFTSTKPVIAALRRRLRDDISIAYGSHDNVEKTLAIIISDVWHVTSEAYKITIGSTEISDGVMPTGDSRTDSDGNVYHMVDRYKNIVYSEVNKSVQNTSYFHMNMNSGYMKMDFNNLDGSCEKSNRTSYMYDDFVVRGYSDTFTQSSLMTRTQLSLYITHDEIYNIDDDSSYIAQVD